jgi:hypothetical protein
MIQSQQGGRMKPLFFLITFAFSLPPSADQPYELKGEAPGMTLKQFRTGHKHAECSKQSATLTTCHVYDGVSFAGVIAYTFRGLWDAGMRATRDFRGLR